MRQHGRCIGTFAECLFKLCRGFGKRQEPEKAGPASGPVGHLAQLLRFWRVLVEPVQLHRKLGAKHMQPGQGIRLSEDGTGLAERLRVLNTTHPATGLFAIPHACHVASFHNRHLETKVLNMKYPKHLIPVKATLQNGSRHFGGVHVSQDQRVLDVLCDDRDFIPFRLKDRTILLNKSWLVQIDLLGLAEITEMQDILPEVNLDYLKANAW